MKPLDTVLGVGERSPKSLGLHEPAGVGELSPGLQRLEPSGSQTLGYPDAAGSQGRAENRVGACRLDLAQGRRGKEGRAQAGSCREESPWLALRGLGLVEALVVSSERLSAED